MSRAELRASYRWCRELCQKSGSNFYASFRLLDKTRRGAMYALYAFSRISDDLSDDLSEPNERTSTAQHTRSEDKAELLSEWRELLASQVSGPASAPSQMRCSPKLAEFAPLWPALQDASERFAIQPQWLREIVDGVCMDTSHQQPSHWQDLECYCYHVASAVGLACSAIWKKSSTSIPVETAIHCGYGFQYTNMLRDIAEDARAGRVYLPQSLFEKHDVDIEQWRAGSPNGGWLDMIEEVADRANTHYHDSWQLIQHYTPDSQRMFSLIWRTYRGLLDEVTSQRQNLWKPNFRVSLPKHKKLKLFAQHYFSPLYRRLPPPCPSP